MPTFNNNYEDFIKKIITAETTALNSEKGQKILKELLNKAKEQNPDLTVDEWAEIKKQFMLSVFREILKENPNFMSQFIGIVVDKIQNERKDE